MIKHLCKLDDRETVDQISENMYMQYFLGYSSFTNEVPFDASLFVEIRSRLGVNQINAMNEKIHALHQGMALKSKENMSSSKNNQDIPPEDGAIISPDISESANEITHQSRVLFDATACPQDIA